MSNEPLSTSYVTISTDPRIAVRIIRTKVVYYWFRCDRIENKTRLVVVSHVKSRTTPVVIIVTKWNGVNRADGRVRRRVHGRYVYVFTRISRIERRTQSSWDSSWRHSQAGSESNTRKTPRAVFCPVFFFSFRPLDKFRARYVSMYALRIFQMFTVIRW